PHVVDGRDRREENGPAGRAVVRGVAAAGGCPQDRGQGRRGGGGGGRGGARAPRQGSRRPGLSHDGPARVPRRRLVRRGGRTRPPVRGQRDRREGVSAAGGRPL